MVHFGQRIAKERYAPWVDHYFDYDLLKRKLKSIQNASGQSQRDEAIQEFQHALDREIEKVGPDRLTVLLTVIGKQRWSCFGCHEFRKCSTHPGLQYVSSCIPDLVLHHFCRCWASTRTRLELPKQQQKTYRGQQRLLLTRQPPIALSHRRKW